MNEKDSHEMQLPAFALTEAAAFHAAQLRSALRRERERPQTPSVGPAEMLLRALEERLWGVSAKLDGALLLRRLEWNLRRRAEQKAQRRERLAALRQLETIARGIEP